MNKKNNRNDNAGTKELKQKDCSTQITARQAVELIDFASSMFRYHTALLATCEVGLKTLGDTNCAEWQSAIRNFETAEIEMDKAWEVVKAQGYPSKAAAYAKFIKVCSH